jgi:hypothetical protein
MAANDAASPPRDNSRRAIMTNQIFELSSDDCAAVSGGSGYINSSGRTAEGTAVNGGGTFVTSGG